MSDIRSDSNRALALAGVFLAARLVQQIAREGRGDSAELETCLGSLFTIDSDSVAAVYGGTRALRTGLQTMRSELGRPTNPELTRYVVALLHHERRLASRPDLQQRIREGIGQAAERRELFGLTHDNLVAGLAETYSNTLSLLQPRIMVRGEPHLLNITENANLIRALLLSGVRSAVLWHQCGGGRWRLLLGRRRLIAEAQRLLLGTEP